MEPRATSRELGRRPGLLLHWFFRVPVLLYRVGLGWLMFGQMMVTTVGRRSGRPHRAVVDVLGHDPETDTYHIISAYGGASDWYRNLRANPRMQAQVRFRTFPAQATVLPQQEAEQVLLDFWRRHRLYVRAMLRLVGLKARTQEEARAAAAEMRIVAIRPVSEG